MDEKVKEQILAIRDTGLTNMFDVNMVQRLAYEKDFYELVLYLEDHRKEYVNSPSAPPSQASSRPLQSLRSSAARWTEL